jgi:hypothetical protein
MIRGAADHPELHDRINSRRKHLHHVRGIVSPRHSFRIHDVLPSLI